MILKDELSQIVQAEQATSKQLELEIQKIAQEKIILEKELYETLKNHKNTLHEKLQLAVSQIKEDINSKFVAQLAIKKQEIDQQYQQYQLKSTAIEQMLIDYLWKQ